MAETQTTTYYTLKEIATLRGWAEQKLRRFVRSHELGPMLPTNGKKGKGRAFSDTAVEMLAKHAAEFAPGRAATKASKPKAAKKAKAPKKRKVSKKKAAPKVSTHEATIGGVDYAVKVTGPIPWSETSQPATPRGLKDRLHSLESQVDAMVGTISQLTETLQAVRSEIG